MTFRVGLDVTPELFAATGVARYSRELGHALERRGDCELVRFAVGRRTHQPDGKVRHLPVPLRLIHSMWRRWSFPKAEAMTGAVDLVHSLDLVAPPTRRPLVVTVHDLVAVEHPELHPVRTVELQRQRLLQLDRAAAIIAVSNSTADALVRLGIARERIHVTQLGLTPLPAPAAVSLPPGRFILAVGTAEPRKGHELLIAAFAAAGLSDVYVVFAGPTAGRSDLMRRLATELGIGERLVILGQVDDAVLSGLYLRASALCMPSVAEGFGLPVLEALSVGLPVVASDIAALREVASDAAVLVPPRDQRALSEALVRVLGDAELRARLERQGPPRAARFTWDATASATIGAYRHALDVTR
jgi:glycosyltransferase involved in cell wall biosynthesis